MLSNARVAVALAMVLIVGTSTACGSADDPVSLVGLEFCFLDYLDVAEDAGNGRLEVKQPADIDLSRATSCIADDAIVAYTWAEHSIDISADSLPPPDGWPTGVVFGFVMSFDGTAVASGPALLSLVATRIEGPQLRVGIGLEGSAVPLNLLVGGSIEADPLRELGVSEGTADAIRSHFEHTGRLR